MDTRSCASLPMRGDHKRRREGFIVVYMIITAELKMKKETVTHVLFAWDLCQVALYPRFHANTNFIKNVSSSCGSTVFTRPAHYVVQLFLLVLRNFMKMRLGCLSLLSARWKVEANRGNP